MLISHVISRVQIIFLMCCIDGRFITTRIAAQSPDIQSSLNTLGSFQDAETHIRRRIARAPFPSYRDRPVPTFKTTTISSDISALITCKIVKNVKRKCWTLTAKQIKICKVIGVSNKEVCSRKLKIKVNSKVALNHKLWSSDSSSNILA